MLRPLRVLFVAALAATTALAVPTVATAAPAVTSTGTLHWGFKQSFRDYVTEAGIHVMSPALRAGDGTFDFPLTSAAYDPDAGTTTTTFSGGVHFQAHDDGAGGYLLDITMRDPQISLARTGSTLSMLVTSRELLAGNQGGPVKDYGRIPVAMLSPTAANVSVAGGTTTWQKISAALTGDAVPAFLAYAKGTALDTVGFDYQGAGGAPPTDETFTPAGTPLLERGATFSDPDPLSLDAVYPDAARGVVYVVRGNFATHSVQALDATTMQPVSGEGVLDPQTGYLSAFDPASGTVFVVQDDGQVTSAHWTGQSWSTAVVGSVTGTVTALTWNAHDAALDAVVTSDPDAAVQVWTRDGTGWSSDTRVLPAPPADQSVASGWYGSPRTLRNLAAATDGTLVLVRVALDGATAAPDLLRLVPSASDVDDRATVLAGSAFVADADDPVPTVGWTQVTTGRDGQVYLLRKQNSSSVARLVDGRARDRVDLADTDVGGLAADDDGIVYLGAPNNKQLIMVRDGQVLRRTAVDDLGFRLTFGIAVDADHTVYVETRDGFPLGFGRFTRDGLSPAIDSQPQFAHVTTSSVSASTTAEFTAAASGQPAPDVQWQVSPVGATAFTDLNGATSARLERSVTAADNGSRYRAVFRNAAGSIATGAVDLQVDSPAAFTAGPADTTVTPGRDAFFTSTVVGTPTPTVRWQVDSGSGWQPVTSSTPGFTLTGTALAVTKTTTAQSGLRVRAEATNVLGTTTSTAATLTVTATPTTRTLRGVSLVWSGNQVLQKASPAGPANYFSAGVSDGSAKSYRASAGDVTVFEKINGRTATATYAARNAFDTGGQQWVLLRNGSATLQADGSATVSWTGSWSVNFYGGLVPFTLTDPVLHLDELGAGTLTAGLSGYASSRTDPTSKTKLPAVRNVTVATVRGVSLTGTGATSITPVFAGVPVSGIPAGAQAQNRQVSGWGAWPQSFVDYQFRTGLSSYWYTSGGGEDADKPAAAFVVDFSGASNAPPALVKAPTAASIDQPLPITAAQNPADPAVVDAAAASGALASTGSDLLVSVVVGVVALLMGVALSVAGARRRAR